MGEVREGDWVCPNCGNHNYAIRQVCNRCQGPRPPPPGERTREGDWLCPMCNNHNYARRTLCNKCQTLKPGFVMSITQGMVGLKAIKAAGKGRSPMPSAGMVGKGVGGKGYNPGDWPCTKCGNLNYASREQCNRCGVQKQFAAAGAGNMNTAFGCNGTTSYAQQAMSLASMRPGDWFCKACGNHNYASRDVCNKCNAPKDVPTCGAASALPQKSAATFRAGDWLCAKCKNHNYASREMCNKCKGPKTMMANF